MFTERQGGFNLEAVREMIIKIITTRPISTILGKASTDFVFSSFYILVIGLAVIGIVNLSLKINNKRAKHTAAVNTILFVLLILSIVLADTLFWFIRNN